MDKGDVCKCCIAVAAVVLFCVWWRSRSGFSKFNQRQNTDLRTYQCSFKMVHSDGQCELPTNKQGKCNYSTGECEQRWTAQNCQDALNQIRQECAQLPPSIEPLQEKCIRALLPSDCLLVSFPEANLNQNF